MTQKFGVWITFIADGLNVLKLFSVFGFGVSFFGSVPGVCQEMVVGPRGRDGRIVLNPLTLRARTEPWCLRM